MSSKKKSYYVVWDGVDPGIYESWDECKLQVQGYQGAKYKKYSSLEEANRAFAGGPPRSKPKPKPQETQERSDDILLNAIAVDAACSGNPGDMEYRGVYVLDHREIFRRGPFKMGTNNIGEFLAIVHILALLDNKNDHTTPIYTDSKTAMAWIKRRKANTKLKRTYDNKELFHLIGRAEKWLHLNKVKNPIHKWNTKMWGEIPADFGRK